MRKLPESIHRYFVTLVFGLLYLAGTHTVSAAPNIIISADQGAYTISTYTVYTITGAPPNSPIYWSSWKDGVSTGETLAYYGHMTDSNGRWSLQASQPWFSSQVGFWKKQVTIGGRSSFTTFYVLPSLTTNSSLYSVGTNTIYYIAGAPPFSPIYWSSWKDGVSTGEVDAFYGHYTDANGVWTATSSSPWNSTQVGHWKKIAKIGSTSNFGTKVEILVTDGIQVNKPTFTTSELTTYSITGAPPNSPIYWSSWQDGAQREISEFYEHYTDSLGNWSASASSGWLPEWVGFWKKQASVGAWVKTVTFSVTPRKLSNENVFAQKVSSYMWGTGVGDGAKLVGDLGARTLHMLFDAKGCNPNIAGCNTSENPFITYAQSSAIVKEFSDPRINTYVLTIFGGRSVRDVAYLTSNGVPLRKQFYSPDLFNPSISPIPDYRQRIINDYQEFAQYLVQTYRGTGKRFILSNWETDNVIRCGEASSFADNSGRRPPKKICLDATPVGGVTSDFLMDSCPAQSPQALAKACAVGAYPNEEPRFVRENETCPQNTNREVFPVSLSVNGGWIPQDPNDTSHFPKWSYSFRDWCDGYGNPENPSVQFNLKTYNGLPAVSNDMVDGFQRVFEARQEGVRQGRENAATQGWGGVEVYHAPEFNTINLLRKQGFKNVVNDALPNLNFDFAIYSAYETTTSSVLNPGETPSIDMNRIIGDDVANSTYEGGLNMASKLMALEYVVNNGTPGRYRNLLIGEFAFNFDQASTPTGANAIYGTVLDTVTNWGVPYAFNWTVFEYNPHWRGLYSDNTSRMLLPLGNYYKQRYTTP